MNNLVLPAALFTGEPVEREVEYPNGKKVRFLLLPITGDLDAKYTKLRGLDRQELKFRPTQAEDGSPSSVVFEPIGRTFSNEKELDAAKWLAERVIRGWSGLMLDDGSELAFTKENLLKLITIPSFTQPAIKEAYALGQIVEEIEEGNSGT
jgi:hypothetical protein